MIHDIQQADGGEQGHALTPSRFCMGFRRALADVQAQLSGDHVVVAYPDDTYLVTVREIARAAYDSVKDITERACNIDANTGKLFCWTCERGDAPTGIDNLGDGV